MPSLDELRNKWFLNFNSSESSFPLVTRHEGTNVSNYTDGNLVTLLIDGQNYMKEWHDSIRAMISQPGCEVYHVSWGQDDVRTLGQSKPNSDALKTLNDAQNGGVKLYILLSHEVFNLSRNAKSVSWLNTHGISNACMDQRFPPVGSNHQKFTCLKNPSNIKAILGSIDIVKDRWDTTSHLLDEPERPKSLTHDLGVAIQGPAVADIEWTFRERWNDDAISRITLTRLGPLNVLPLPKITMPVSSPSTFGTHSVQVLHTYGRSNEFFSYSWAPEGEFTIWASYLNAIKTANNYIYIEDQYFFPFDWLPCHLRKGKSRDSDLFYQLGEAIKRGVKVVVVVAHSFEEKGFTSHMGYQRNFGVYYLANIADSNSGDFVVAYLHNDESRIFVHSKVMICDDEFVVVGSANFNQRAMTHDSELSIGIVDAANQFARDLRKQLWGEHLQRTISNDPDAAFTIFKEDVAASRGRVRPYSTDYPGVPLASHGWRMRNLIDPYAGPPRL